MPTLAEQKTALDEQHLKVQQARQELRAAKKEDKGKKNTLLLIRLQRYRIMLTRYKRDLEDAKKLEEGKIKRLNKSLASLK